MNKKLKVIEAFAGYGSQAMALKSIGFELSEDSAIIEWTVDAIIAYASAHHYAEFQSTMLSVKAMIEERGKDFIAKGMANKYVLSTEKTKGWIIGGKVVKPNTAMFKELDTQYKEQTGKGLKEHLGDPSYLPLLESDWIRMKEDDLVKIVAAMKVSKNFGSIMDVKGTDVRTHNADLFTYSFPCQDLSLAGKQKGIAKGTRSGLLFEVERILEEQTLEQRPKLLLLENVKALVSGKHMNDFQRWLKKLDELGYDSSWRVLNAKEHNLPQNRERVFVLSWKKDSGLAIDLNSIPIRELENKLKDYLEDEQFIEDKYYISDKHVQSMLKWKAFERPLTKVNTINSEDIGTITTRSGDNTSSQKLLIPEVDINGNKVNIEEIFNGKSTILGINPTSPRYRSDNVIHGQNYIVSTLRAGNGMQLVALDYTTFEKKWMDQDNNWNQTAYSGSIIYNNEKINIIIPENEIIRLAQLTNCVELLVKKDGILHFTLADNTTRPIGQKEDGTWLLPISRDYTSTILQENQVEQVLNNQQINLDFDTILPLRIRKITTREAMRLMGVTDEYIDKIFENVTTQSAQFKLAGNSIAVNVLEEIFKLLK